MSGICGTSQPPYSPACRMDLNFNTEIRPVIGGTYDYTKLDNKPAINGVTLVGDKTNEELLIKAIPNTELEEILK